MNIKVWKEFNNNMLTHSAAHYLMAIHELVRDQGYARLVDIAKKLDISKGSLSVSLKPLVEKELILEDENKHFWLSDTGKQFAESVEFNREVLSTFFEKKLKVSPTTAMVNACKIEHLLDTEITKKIAKLS